jgi:hypothetical protein
MPSDRVSKYELITDLPRLILELKEEIARAVGVGLAHERIQEILQVGDGRV